MTQAIIFDFFDVIRTDAYKSWLAAHNIAHDGPYADASHLQDIGAITTEQFLDRLSELMGRKITFEEVDGTASVDDDVVAIVASLHKRYKLALLSNAPSKLIRGILADHKLEQYFDEIIISSEVGVVKPSPEIFRWTLEKLAVGPDEAVFIDDNMHHVEAAGRLGFKAIQFLSARQLKADLKSLEISV